MSAREADRALGCSGVSTSMRREGAYVTVVEWTRAMRHQRSTFHHFVTSPPPRALPCCLLSCLYCPVLLKAWCNTLSFFSNHLYTVFFLLAFFFINSALNLNITSFCIGCDFPNNYTQTDNLCRPHNQRLSHIILLLMYVETFRNHICKNLKRFIGKKYEPIQ